MNIAGHLLPCGQERRRKQCSVAIPQGVVNSAEANARVLKVSSCPVPPWRPTGGMGRWMGQEDHCCYSPGCHKHPRRVIKDIVLVAFMGRVHGV